MSTSGTASALLWTNVAAVGAKRLLPHRNLATAASEVNAKVALRDQQEIVVSTTLVILKINLQSRFAQRYPSSFGPSIHPRKKLYPFLPRNSSHYRFVISEMGGTDQERARLSGGLVFVDSAEQLVETCRYYLEQPELRMAIAARGRQLFEQQLETDILRKPIEAMLRKWEDIELENQVVEQRG